MRIDRRGFIKIAATVGGGVIFKVALGADAEVEAVDVANVDEAAARAMPGVVAVVKVEGRRGETPHWGIEEGVAVVANSTWAAFMGRERLEISWSGGTNAEANDGTMRAKLLAGAEEESTEGVSAGDIDAAMSGAASVVEATYETPFMGHTLMEPLCAVAKVSDGRCEIWAGSQAPQYTSHLLAHVLELPVERITFHCRFSGGGFGRRYFADYVAEAAVISQKVGRPVMSVWSREDEVRHGRYHPMRIDRYRAAIDPGGRWTGVDFVGVTTFFRPASSLMTYPIPHVRERAQQIEPIVNVGAWRSVADHPAAFGKECLVDEIAAKLDVDPFDYRERLLKNVETAPVGGAHAWLWERNAQLRPRFRRVLTALRERSGWDRRRAEGRHCGVAIADFHGSSVCGQVADVAVESGMVRVLKITCVLDCGTVVNPQLVRGQVEGGIVWALTPVLHGGVTVRAGRVAESNFHDTRIPRMDEIPQIDVVLLASEGPPGKVGEVSVPPLAPAVANAVFAATGRRVRGFPFWRYL